MKKLLTLLMLVAFVPFSFVQSAFAAPSITYHTLDTATYADLRWQVISNVEGTVLCPYADSKGIPTIGIGFNLQDGDIYASVINTLAPGLTAAQRTTLKKDVIDQKYTAHSTCDSANPVMAAVNGEMANFIAQNQASNTGVALPTTLNFSSVAQMRGTFDIAVKKTFEPRVDRWLPNIPDSTERIALLSLGYNSATLLGAQLKSAIVNGNRAEAWYQIRYHSEAENNALGKKADEGSAAGLAKRRDFESELFGLYDGNPFNPTTAAVSNTDATQAASMAAGHEAQLYVSAVPDGSDLYNNKYFVNPDSHDPSTGTVSGNEIGSANTDYMTAIAAIQAVEGNFAVRDLADDLGPAVNDLLANPGAATSKSAIVQNTNGTLDLSASSTPFAVFLQTPNTTLTMGSGKGLIYANQGVTINMGAGLEELTIGSGQNTINLPSVTTNLSLDTISFEGHSIATNTPIQNNTTDSFNRNYLFDGTNLTITNGSDSLTINHFQSKDFGVTFQGLVADQDGIGVLDVSTGIEWLPLTHTIHDTYNQIFSGSDPNVPTGYVLATDAQVRQLLLDAGFPALSATQGFNAAAFVPDNGVVSNTFLKLFGMTDSANNLTSGLSKPPDFQGITGTPPNQNVGPFTNTAIYGPSPNTFNHTDSAAAQFVDEIGLNPAAATGFGYFLLKLPA